MDQDNPKIEQHRPRQNLKRRATKLAAVSLASLTFGVGVAGAEQEAAVAPLSKNTPVLVGGNRLASNLERVKERKMGSGVHFNCLSLSYEQRAVVFEDLRKNNIGWVRMNLNWNDLEPDAGTYDEKTLANLDDCVAQASRSTVKPLIVFQGSPVWANGGQNWSTPPINPTDYARAISFLAERYNGRDKTRGEVRAWEIWNEPNNGRFWRGTAEQMAELTRQAYPAIKKANPKAYVLLPGMAQNNGDYLDRLITAGAKFDIVSTHFYPDVSSGDPNMAIQKIGPELDYIVKVIKNHGLKSPVWVTEFGIPRSNNISSEQQAALARTMIKIMQRFPRITFASWFQAQPSGASDNWEESLGSINKNGDPWPVLGVIGGLSTGFK